jgi:carboxyl-terminal processing protease
MGGKLKYALVLPLLALFPAHAAEKAEDAGLAKPGTVTVFPISGANADLYKYEPNEYWIKGTDIVGEFSIKDASEFYLRLFELVHEKFARKVSYDYAVNRVLDALSVFAGRVNMTTAGGRILAHDRDLKLIGNFNRPDDEDGRAWSNLLVNIILALRDGNEKVRNAHPEQIYHLTATYLLKSLDENAHYTDPITYAKAREDYNTTWTGFTYRRVEAGLQVLSIIRNSPAFFSGLAEGDVITHINSRAVKDITPELAEATLTSNDTGILHLDYVTYIMGQPSETYIRKNRIIMPSVSTRTDMPATPAITIHNFKKGAARELKAAAEALLASSPKGIIIDLRAATGGEFDEATEAANLFIDGGDMLKTQGRAGTGGNLYTAKGGDILSGLPIVLLIDNSTKGYAEAFALAMEARKRAVLIGSPTYGMGTVEETFALNKERMATLATSFVTSAGGRALNGIGAVPLVCVSSFKATGDTAKFIANAKSGRFRDNRSIPAEPSKEDIEAARAACPAMYPSAEMQALPPSIAAAILSDPAAYAKLTGM